MEWLNVAAAIVFGFSASIIAWSALRPRQRLYARKFATRWLLYRALGGVALVYVVLINLAFVSKSTSMTRTEIWTLCVTNLEAVFITCVLGFSKLLHVLVDQLALRKKETASRIDALESRLEAICSTVPAVAGEAGGQLLNVSENRRE